MSIPTWKVEVAFGTDPLSDPGGGAWTDITAYCRGLSIRRGRTHELGRTQAGTLDLRLRNTDRRFDPSNAAGPYYPNLLPMRHVRVRATVGVTTYEVFRGYVEDWPQEWSPRPVKGTGDAQVKVRAVDAFKLLNLYPLTRYSDVVIDDAPLAYWRLIEDEGTVAIDSAGDGPYDGAWSGSPSLSSQTGPFAGGMDVADFDATNDFVDVGSPTALKILGDVTVECWVKTDALPAANRALVTAGDPYVLHLRSDGKIRMGATTTDPVDPAQGAASNTALSTGTWYHVVGVRRGRDNLIYLNGVLDTEQPFLGAPIGTAFQVRIGSDGATFFDGKLAYVAIYPEALTPERIAEHYAAKVDRFKEQASGAHVTAVLDAIGWPAGLRAVDAGNSTIQELEPSGSALDHLLKVCEDTEYGLLEITPAGVVSFSQRHDLWTGHISLLATFGDDPGTPTEIPYADVQVTYDDKDLYTRVEVSRQGGIEQMVEDVAAKAAYGPRTLPRSGVLFATDNEARDMASYLLSRYKAPALRPRSLELMAGPNDDTRLGHMLGRGMQDRIRLVRRPPGGGSMSVNGLIEGIAHDVTPPFDFTTTFDLVPADSVKAWILGDTTYSELGATTIPGF